MVAPPALHSGVPSVSCGLDVLVGSQLKLLRGRRFGLLAHQASVNDRLEHAISLLRDVRGAKLTALFAPEHGLWGAPQDHATIANDRDPVSGLRVTSLYGERREPTAAMLAGLDVLVIDLQDIGSRYYTYVWTMVLAMKAGLDPGKVLKLVAEGAGTSRVLQLRGPMMVKGSYRKATMTLATWQKDMAIIAEFARRLGVSTPLFSATAPIYAEAVKTRSREDTAAVCAVLEKMAHYRR